MMVNEDNTCTAPTKLPKDEKLDILEFASTLEFQVEMYQQGFNPIKKSEIEFIQFCKWLEPTEDLTLNNNGKCLASNLTTSSTQVEEQNRGWAHTRLVTSPSLHIPLISLYPVH